VRFISMIYGDKDYEAGRPPDPKLMEAMGKYTEEMLKSGVVLSAEGLLPSSHGARITLVRAVRTPSVGRVLDQKLIEGDLPCDS